MSKLLYGGRTKLATSHSVTHLAVLPVEEAAGVVDERAEAGSGAERAQ